MRSLPFAFRLAPLALLPAALPLGAQAPGAGTLSGLVVDADSAGPVAGAYVSLDAGAHAVLPAAGSVLLRAIRTTRADERGEFRFDGVAPGGYRLHAQGAGYAPATVELAVPEPGAARGVRVEPILLHAVRPGSPERRAPSWLVRLLGRPPAPR